MSSYKKDFPGIPVNRGIKDIVEINATGERSIQRADDTRQSSSNLSAPKQALSKQDLELVLEVNKKSIEINNAVLVANDEIQTMLVDQKDEINKLKKVIYDSQDKVLEKIVELEKKTIEVNTLKEKILKTYDLSEKFDRDMFKLMVLISTGAIGLILQVIQMLMKK